MKAAVRPVRGTLGDRVKFQRQARERLCRSLKIISEFRHFLRANGYVISSDFRITSNNHPYGLYHLPLAFHFMYLLT